MRVVSRLRRTARHSSYGKRGLGVLSLVPFEGVEIKRRLCITNVWMRRNSHWQIVARHTASLPDDTPPAS